MTIKRNDDCTSMHNHHLQFANMQTAIRAIRGTLLTQSFYKRYSKIDEILLFDMLKEEGDDWSDYHSINGCIKYALALATSITYVVYNNDILCGFARC